MILNCYKFEFSENLEGFRIFQGQQHVNEWRQTCIVSNSVETQWMNFSTLCSLRWFAIHFFARGFHTCTAVTLARLSCLHFVCKQPLALMMTTEMHKIFSAQKSYCACFVLRLATIRSEYYFNFIPNRTRSGRELFSHPLYEKQCEELVNCDVWNDNTSVWQRSLSMRH